MSCCDVVSLLLPLGHYGPTCEKPLLGYQLQNSKKEFARFATYPEVDRDREEIVDLTDNAQPLGPVVMPPMPAGSSSTFTGFTADNPPPLPCARSICVPTRSLPTLIGAKVLKDFGEKYGVFRGVIMSFDATSKLFMVRDREPYLTFVLLPSLTLPYLTFHLLPSLHLPALAVHFTYLFFYCCNKRK